MVIYNFLTSIGMKKSYTLKFFLIAFIGTHIPLIGIIFYIVFSLESNENTNQILLIILGLTLIATALTLVALNQLLAPVKEAMRIITDYRKYKIINEINVNSNDEMGLLLKSITKTFKEIKGYNEERNNFINLIAHDIRNPLVTIKGFCEIIHDIDDLKSIKKYLTIIEKASNDGLTIARDTLDILKTDNYEIQRESFTEINVLETIKYTTKMLEGFKIKKEITLKLNIDSNDSLNIEPNLFSHIIQNLVSNAIKYSLPMGNIYIDGKKSNDFYEISITDEGIGFDVEDPNSLFEKYSSDKSKTANGDESTGIGLYLTKILVTKLNGTISAQSKGKFEGVTISLQFPI